MDGQTRDRHGPVQFSLRALLVVTAVAAVLCALLTAGSPVVRWFAGLAILFLLPMLCTVMLVYGRGYQRTFAIGAIFPSGLWFLTCGMLVLLYTYAVLFGGSSISWDEFRDSIADFATTLAAIAAADLIVSIVFGLLAAGLRWTIEPRR